MAWLSDWWVCVFLCAWRSKSVSGCETGPGASSGLRRRSPLEAVLPVPGRARSRLVLRVAEAARAGATLETKRLHLPWHDTGSRPINHTGGDVASRHDKDRNGHAQPDGWRPAPALGASAARHPSACWPERNTKTGCARTPGRRPPAAFQSGFTAKIGNSQRRTIPRANSSQASTIRPSQPRFSKATQREARRTSAPMLKHASHASPKIHLHAAPSKNRICPYPRNRPPDEPGHSEKQAAKAALSHLFRTEHATPNVR